MHEEPCRFLGNFAMSKDGESFHFTELNLANKNIDTLAKTIEEAKEVYYCYLTGNNIAEPSPLKELPNLIHLDLSKNKIKSLTVFQSEENLVNLKYLDLNSNQFKEFGAFKCPKLEYLDVSFNKLEKVNDGWTGLPNLRILKSVDNKFKNMNFIKGMPKLEECYLANNNIASLEGYSDIPSLKKLHLRRNKIAKFPEEMAELPALEFLNLRSNQIENMEMVLKLFATFTALNDLNVINTPVELSFSSMNVFLAQLMQTQPKVKRFCKVEVSDAHRLEAVFLGKYKFNKREEERIAAEEKAKAEEAAAAEQEG